MKRKVKFFWLTFLAIDLVTFFLLAVLGYNLALGFFLGSPFAAFYTWFYRTLFRPKIRVCDHFSYQTMGSMK